MNFCNRIYLILLLALSSCATSSTIGLASAQSDRPLLKQEEAEYRKRLIALPRYTLSFEFDATRSFYQGTAQIKFEWRGTDKEIIWLDFNGGEVESLTVNSRPIDFERTAARIVFSPATFSVGENLISVRFKHDYSSDGTGLYRFQDPEDKSVYLYTTLQPFDACKVFPLFDQPDLKAQFQMTVRAPADWTVVGYDQETSVNLSNRVKEWNFPQSLPISSYLWSIHAGPYRMWSDDRSRFPSRLFARKTMARYVKAEDWFHVTRQGMDFFEKYFDEPYVFKKYDQIIVPDFKAGAMENVGAVTFSEDFISRGEELHSEKRSRAEVILHEMAHMWFGNLVTMEWWNDLWLNESFATYMAYVALARSTEFSGEEAWRDFYGMKMWAYQTDLSVKTHPIEAHISTTDDAFASFDGITYGKGASLMKQLEFFLGSESFQKGIRLYFDRHRFSNTRLSDFIGALEEGSGKDLKRWSRDWLRSSGLNSVSFQPVCRGTVLESVRYEQKSVNGDALNREQKTRLGLYRMFEGRLELYQSFDVDYSGASGNINVNQEIPCPRFIFPNHEDHAYFIAAYTADDVRFLINNLMNFESAFSRKMLVHDMWLATRRGEVRLADFSDLVYRALGMETDEDNVEYLLSRIKSRWGDGIYTYTDFDSHEGLESFEDLTWELLRKSPKGSELQKLYKRFYVGFAMSPNHRRNLMDLLDSRRSKQLKISLDPDERWRAIQQLSMMNEPSVQTYLDLELRRDSSHDGRRNHLRALALRPDAEAKKLLFDQIVTNNPPMTAAQVGIVASSLFPPTQRNLGLRFQEEFFSALEKVRGHFEPERLSSFLALIPEECFQGKRGLIQEYLKTARNLETIVVEALGVADQEQNICRKVRERDRKTEKKN